MSDRMSSMNSIDTFPSIFCFFKIITHMCGVFIIKIKPKIFLNDTVIMFYLSSNLLYYKPVKGKICYILSFLFEHMGKHTFNYK